MAHLFDHQLRSFPHSRHLITFGIAFLIVLITASAGIALIQLREGKAAQAAGGSKRVPATSTPLPAVAPVSKAWYFPEGKVGQGFTEYLTIENPDAANDCNVTLYYIGSSGSPVTKSVTVPRASRFTEPVNADLNTPASSTSAKNCRADRCQRRLVSASPNRPR